MDTSKAAAGPKANQGGLLKGAQAFFEHQAAAGIVLLSAAVFALALDNSPLYWLYDALLQTPVVIQVGALILQKPLLLWINDGLMAVFFFLVGLELKREVLDGQLSSVRSAVLPFAAALGGMACPAIIYSLINQTDATAMRGWAIPAATDIAFALGVLALLGSRVPAALKIFLLALAIIDDIGAILIIAIFYTADLSTTALGLALIGVVGLAVLNRTGVTNLAPYLLVGAFIWVCVLKSGVHATLAGVAVALFIPVRDAKRPDHSPLKEVEHSLAPWVAFGIMPIFAFANAGVALYNLSIDQVFDGIPLGIAAGLFFGNQIGIMAMSWLAVRSGLAQLPDGLTWSHIYAASLLAGIGFTMSLFIGTLAFTDPESAAGVRIGVLGGSLLSGVVGYFVLRRVLGQTAPAQASA